MRSCNHPCCGDTCRKQKPRKQRKPLPRAKAAIRKKSTKQCTRDRQYSIIRRVFLKTHPYCQARLEGCHHAATDVHHKRGRGERLLDVETFLVVCRHCHQWIEVHPAEAKELGFSLNRLTA